MVTEDHTLFTPLLLKTEMPDEYSPSIKDRGDLPEAAWVSTSDRHLDIKQETEDQSRNR